MSFQGDVGGIGLADLLQSLARGRDGVLSLLGREGLRATLGFQEGQVHLLPDPEEDPEIWRHHARSAWVKDPEGRIDSLRMTEIARAHRIEMVYRLLDSEGVHFRFAPGPLPEKPTDSAISQGEPGTERGGTRRDAIYVAGMSVEGLLLEYARMKDEAMSAAVDWPNFEDAVLVPLDPYKGQQTMSRFFEECDGASSIAEIADRLAQPQRQVFLTAVNELQRGTARLANHEELLVMTQHETGSGMVGRAASRLRAWLVCAPYGPMPTVEAQIFQTEWEAGRLQPVLRELATPSLRVFLRRLDCALGVPLVALDHWNEVARVRRDDRISQVRLVHLQAIASADPNAPALRDLLAMARAFIDAERKLAASAVLRVAASKLPESTNVRLELGTLMLQAGMGLEAGPWILDAAATLLEEGNAEKALPPLREYVAIDPSNREARRLLGRARTHAVQRTLVKRNSLVAIAVLLSLSVGAVVQFRSQRAFDEKIEAVTARLDDPHEALRVLDSLFQGDDGSRVTQMRATLVEKRRIADQAGRSAWMDRYREAQVECTLGDPVLGLRRTLEMPPPPKFGANEEPLPLLSDLFNSLAARVEAYFVEIGGNVEESQPQLKAEARITMLLSEFLDVIEKAGSKPESVEFKKRLAAFTARLDVRVEKRRADRAAKAKKDNLAQQDMLIGAARAHASAGDYERALELYRELFEKDDTGKLKSLLAKEVDAVRAKSQALIRAEELSRAGRQADAYALLVEVLKEEAQTRELPWKVASFPAGARVTLPDGSVRVTPFMLQSVWEEIIPLSMELAGYEPAQWSVEHPADQFVELSRIPDRSWKRGGRVEALPVKVGEDHVVCDRDGHIARISKSSNLTWKHDLQSLGGVARTPVFLTQTQGRMLIATEDGDAFIVDASNGALEGPWSYGKPPTSGPEIVGEVVRVRFRDGAVYEWTNRLKPEEVTAGSTAVEPKEIGAVDDAASTAGLAVLRRRSSSNTVLESPWTDLEVVVGAETFTVRTKSDQKTVFLAKREGDWTYVAWEAPHARASRGRLWTSDGRGLRSFLP
ncbi:MAG: DUF4388 domain-containing protein [Planctomycetota bacterium]|nr:DUF4388 domain-containing protein [Planctomycetota bacterium]